MRQMGLGKADFDIKKADPYRRIAKRVITAEFIPKGGRCRCKQCRTTVKGGQTVYHWHHRKTSTSYGKFCSLACLEERKRKELAEVDERRLGPDFSTED